MNPFEDYSQVVDSSAVAMFSIKKLSWDKSSLRSSKTGKSKVISQLAANNGMVFAATNACTVVRWNLADGSRTSDLIDVSNRSDDSIEHVFTDPTGSHAVISMKSLDNYYLHSRQIKPKKLSKLQGVIKCACFDKAQTSDASAKFLVGTSIGAIYEVLIDSSGKEKFCQQVYQVTENIPITSIHFEPLPTGGSNRSGKTGEFTNKYLVMCATSSPTRLYHFIGGPTFQALFAAYSNTNASPFTELPGEIPKAELYCFRGTQSNLVQNFALTTEMGIYHGTVQFKESSTPE